MHKKLEEFKDLQFDWDSYGAKPITIVSLEQADFLLNFFNAIGAKEPQIVPTRDGGVQLEWHICGLDVEIEIFSIGGYDLAVFKNCKLISGSRKQGEK